MNPAPTVSSQIDAVDRETATILNEVEDIKAARRRIARLIEQAEKLPNLQK